MQLAEGFLKGKVVKKQSKALQKQAHEQRAFLGALESQGFDFGNLLAPDVHVQGLSVSHLQVSSMVSGHVIFRKPEFLGFSPRIFLLRSRQDQRKLEAQPLENSAHLLFIHLPTYHLYSHSFIRLH